MPKTIKTGETVPVTDGRISLSVGPGRGDVLKIREV